MKAARLVLALVVTSVACVSASSGDPSIGSSSGLGPLGSRREERVLISEASEITGVAASRRFVFATTRSQLLVLDRQHGRWLLPVSLGSSFGAAGNAVAADPAEDAAWIAMPGVLVYYNPALDMLTSAIVPGVVDAIVFDQRDPGAGAYVRASGRWLLASRTGSAIPVGPEMLPPPGARIVAPTLRDLYRQYPALQGTQALLTGDPGSRSWPVVAGAKTPDVSEVWLGTRGGGLYKVDPLFMRAEHFPFGLLERGAGAVAITPDGVWTAGLGAPSPSGRSGLTHASGDLQQWRWLEGPITRPLAGARAYRMAVHGDAIWVATTRGAARLDARDDKLFRLWTLGSGLPADAALAVAATSTGAWVGTARGTVFITDGDSRAGAQRGAVSAAVAPGTATRALLLAGDTLWLGTDGGLLLLRGASPDSTPRRAAAASREPALNRPIRALAASDSLVAIATDDALVLLDVRSGRLLPRYASLDPRVLRGVTAMAMDARSIWLAGFGGVLMIERSTGLARLLSAPGQMPGEAFDVQLDADFGWVATREGLLRLRRAPSGSVP